MVRIALVFVAVGILSAVPVAAQETLRIDARDATLQEVIEMIHQNTGLSVVSQIKGSQPRLTVHAEDTPEQLLYAVADAAGLVVDQRGATYILRSIAGAAEGGTTVVGGAQPGAWPGAQMTPTYGYTMPVPVGYRDRTATELMTDWQRMQQEYVRIRVPIMHLAPQEALDYVYGRGGGGGGGGYGGRSTGGYGGRTTGGYGTSNSYQGGGYSGQSYGSSGTYGGRSTSGGGLNLGGGLGGGLSTGGGGGRRGSY